MDPERIVDEFPAPEYRGNQEQALRDIREAFLGGNDVVIVRAPTGSGKSLLARAIAGCARRPEDAAPSEATDAYYTTPQVSQLDDVAADPLLSDLAVIRGKSNYTCILPGEHDTPVNRAPCARRKGYDCAIQHRCPYFADRAIASNRAIAATTLAYFMRTAGSDVFGTRDVVVVDEAHGLAEWAELYATIRLGPRTVPFWDELSVPRVDGLDRTARFAEQLAQRCQRRAQSLNETDELEPAEVAERDRLQELAGELERFVEDYRDPNSPTTWLVDQEEPDDGDGDTGSGSGGAVDESAGNESAKGDGRRHGGPLSIKPTNPARYLTHTLWDRGNAFALLSATILNREGFCRQVGLDPERVALVDVEHTFPVEHRPLYDVTCGPMTYEHRDRTLPEIARTIAKVMVAHPDEKGLIHAHSYGIQRRLVEELSALGVGERVRAHDRDGRDEALATWMAEDAPTVFVSVKMEEALDLAGDLARWQVLCKAPFPNTSDSRVAHRLADGQWAWYYRTALRTIIQACGRIVRGPDDYGATYLADSSLLDCFERGRADLPSWFIDQVDRMSTPELPALDPIEALSGLDAVSPGTPRRGAAGASRAGRGTTEGASGSASSGRRDSAAADGPEARNDPPERSGSDGQRGRSRRSGRRDSPVTDVWESDD